MSTARRSNLDQRATTSDSDNSRTKLERAGASVAEDVNHLTSWLESGESISTVIALRQRFEDIRRAELTRLQPKLSGLSQEARARLDEITQRIIDKLLLTPTEQLELLSDETMKVRYVDALNRLFRLAVDDRRSPR